MHNINHIGGFVPLDCMAYTFGFIMTSLSFEWGYGALWRMLFLWAVYNILT